MALAVLIMAGGSGTRLWPISRRGRPKQFAPVVGPDSLLEQTYARVRSALPGAQIFVNVTQGNEHWVHRLLPELPAAQVIAAPEDRDTLPTLGFAILQIERLLPAPTLLLLASDNWIGQGDPLGSVFEEAVDAARRGPHLVSIGIRPTAASTQFGYMRIGERAPFGRASYVGLGYQEKPTQAVAEQLLATGDHDWNSGMFAWTAATFWSAMANHAPASAAVFDRLRAGLGTLSADERGALFHELAKTAIDTGILEHVGPFSAQRHVFVRAALAWDDLGNYAALAVHLPRDDRGNRMRGPVRTPGARDCLVMSDGVPVEVRDVDGLIVVSDGGHLLVADRRRHAEVRELAETPLFSGAWPASDASFAGGNNRFIGFVKSLRSRGCVVRSHGDGIIALLDVNDLDVEVRTEGVRVAPRSAPAIGCDPRVDAPRWTPAFELIVTEDEARMSETAAAHVVAALQRVLAVKARPTVMFSAGRTPMGMFSLFRSRYRTALDWSRVRVAQMDEWAGVDPVHAYSTFLRHELVDALGMRELVAIDPTWDTEALAIYERALLDEGLDLVVHGIGCNGHLGFNEPGTRFDAAAGLVRLATMTRTRVASSFGGIERVPVDGLTLGLRALNSAQEVVLMASSSYKSPALRDALFGPVDPRVPASSLQSHPRLAVFIDAAAASTWLRGDGA